MKRLACLLALLSLAVAEPTPKDQIESMTWIAGVWQGSMWGGTWTSYYAAPSEGKLLSYSRLLVDGKLRFYEFEVFEATKDGVVFLPHPRGSPAKPLTLTKLEDRKATFENPKKDYPTRIVYHRAADHRLVITLTDPHNKSDKKEVFELKRVP